MPSLEEHYQHSLKLYGIGGRDIHEWIDFPVRKYAGSHRSKRHNLETEAMVKQIFENKIASDGKPYGERAVLIFHDHLSLDAAETARKNREKTLASKQEESNNQDDEKQRRIKKLKNLKTKNIRDFIQVRYADKDHAFGVAVHAFAAWENYLSSHDRASSEIAESDIIGYSVSLLNSGKGKEYRTVADYLGYLIPYLKQYHRNQQDAIVYAKKLNKDYTKKAKEEDKNAPPLMVRDVIRLYRQLKPQPQYQIVMRLLLLNPKIPIENFGKILVHKDTKGKYHFTCRKKGTDEVVEIDQDTQKMAKDYIEKRLSQEPSRLLTMEAATIQDTFNNFEERYQLHRKIKPHDLKEFGRLHDKGEIIAWLDGTWKPDGE